MENAVGEVQNILVLGGRSEIGVAIARELLTQSTQRVTLACRRPDETQDVEASLVREGLRVESLAFDGADTPTHADFIVVILAFGLLGTQEECDDDPQAAVKIAHTNYTGAVSISLEVAKRFRQQGHGRLIILSSVAGERARKANYVYGSTKSGLDAFAQGLSDAMVGTGASVMIVRPGFVHSAMTAGMKAAPFSTTPDVVAKLTVKGLRAGKRIIWTPGILRWVFMVMRHLPVAIWRRMPEG
jgi:decaprenylphospho-beta-D-erythro-pentofuranosid-2-ulose 2-reductase